MSDGGDGAEPAIVAAKRATRRQPAVRAKMHTCCLIVVEDEALLRLLMEMTLETTDFDFRILSTVGAALEALDAEAEHFTVLLTNINLGDAALTGFDLARRARRLNPKIRVIYMSGDAGPRFEQEKVPGAVFLEKPIDTDRLMALLRSPGEPQAADRNGA